MFEKMLIATDLSPASDCLLQCAGELKRTGLKRAVLAHVIYVANTPGLEDTLQAEASPSLRRQQAALAAQGIEATAEMHFGIPAHTLNELAERHNVDAILIGSQGKGILRAATLGSVSAKLIQIAGRPLLLNRIALLEGEQCGLVCARLFESVLFATDFSETAERALDYVAAIAAETGSTVTLLHVLDTTAAKSRLNEENARYLLAAKKERLERRGVEQVHADFCTGDPAEEIVRRGSAGSFSLIVTGNRGKGVVKELLLGSVANEVARRAEVPVLLIPAEH